MDEEKDEEIAGTFGGKKVTHEQAKKLKGKLDKFMSEISADLLDEEDYVLAKKKVRKQLLDIGVPYSLSYLKAFLDGFKTSMGASEVSRETTMLMLTCLAKMVSDLQVDMDLKIDKKV